MPAKPISEDLRRFIVTRVPSVPFVEALLIFRDAHGSPVTVEALAARLYLGIRPTAEIVDQLGAVGIVERVPAARGWLYSPSPELAPILDELAERYRSNLLEVTGLIHSSTGRMARNFSDAFKWRKD